MQNITSEHSLALMAIIHQVTAGNASRATAELTVRERLVVQRIGMSGDQAIAALGKDLGITASSMTSLVDRLESKNYLKRTAHASDRRTTVLSLTRKGQSAFANEIDFYATLVTETLSPLGEKAVTHILQALLMIEAPQSNSDLPSIKQVAKG